MWCDYKHGQRRNLVDLLLLQLGFARASFERDKLTLEALQMLYTIEFPPRFSSKEKSQPGKRYSLLPAMGMAPNTEQPHSRVRALEKKETARLGITCES